MSLPNNTDDGGGWTKTKHQLFPNFRIAMDYIESMPPIKQNHTYIIPVVDKPNMYKYAVITRPYRGETERLTG